MFKLVFDRAGPLRHPVLRGLLFVLGGVLALALLALVLGFLLLALVGVGLLRMLHWATGWPRKPAAFVRPELWPQRARAFAQGSRGLRPGARPAQGEIVDAEVREVP